MSHSPWNKLTQFANDTTHSIRVRSLCNTPAPPFVPRTRMSRRLKPGVWEEFMFDCIQTDGPLHGADPAVLIFPEVHARHKAERRWYWYSRRQLAVLDVKDDWTGLAPRLFELMLVRHPRWLAFWNNDIGWDVTDALRPA